MTIEQKALTVAEKFDAWMINKVKSIHYANHKKMDIAHKRVYEINLQKVCI